MFAALAVLLGLTFQAAPVSAETVEQCGNAYSPAYSEVTTERYGTFFAVTYEFSLSRQERDTLVCLQDWLEIEAPIAGFDLPDWWDEYTVSTNIPGALHDIDASDTEPSPAVTAIWTGDLQPDTWYYFTLSWSAQMSESAVPQVTVRWVPAHWSSTFHPIEGPACGVSVFSGNPAWCIFGTDGQDVDVVQSIYGRVLPFNHGAHLYQLDRGIPSAIPIA